MQPGLTYPGFGVFVAAAPTAKEKAKDLGAAIMATYDRFAAEGPTDEELATAKKQVLSQLEENMKQAQWWAGAIGGLTYRGRSLDDVMGGRAAVEGFTAAEVKAAFGKYYTQPNSMVFTILPEDAPAPAGTPAK